MCAFLKLKEFVIELIDHAENFKIKNFMMREETEWLNERIEAYKTVLEIIERMEKEAQDGHSTTFKSVVE